MAKVTLDDASRAELYAFATQILNLDVPGDATRAAILSLIKKSNPEVKECEVSDAAPLSTMATGSGKPRDQLLRPGPKGLVRIRIQSQDSSNGFALGGNAPVYVNNNGKEAVIPRDTDTDLLPELVGALLDGEGMIYEGDDQAVIKNGRLSSCYPVQILGPV